MTSLKELSPVVKIVNQNRNEINSTIADLNVKLETMHIGIEVANVHLHNSGWEISRNDDGEPLARVRTAHFLGYGKIDDKWQMTYCPCDETQEYTFGAPERSGQNDKTTFSDPAVTALLQAPHLIRLEALRALPKLLDVLKACAEEELKIIAETKSLAAQL